MPDIDLSAAASKKSMHASAAETHLGTHDPGTQQEGKQQLVFFKETAADIAVQGVGEVLLDVGQAHCHSIRLGCCRYGAAKEVDKPGQRVLVHGIYVCQICIHTRVS